MSENAGVLGGEVGLIGVLRVHIRISVLLGNAGQEGGAIYLKESEFLYPDDVVRKNRGTVCF